MPNGMPMPMAMAPGAFNPMSRFPLTPPLYVGDLDENIQEETLWDFFSKFGPLNFVKIARETSTGKSRGFGYVNFMYPRDAENARQVAQYSKLGKKNIRIMFKTNVKDLDNDANLFIKNLDHNVNVKELHEFLKDYGIVIAKLNTNKEGESLGYGYIQFENKEAAEKALGQLQGAKIKESEIQLSKFVPKSQRETPAHTNIYIRNLPTGKSEKELEDLIEKTFSKFGQIKTKLLMKQPKGDKYAAFVCFEEENSANKAVEDEKLKETTLDGADGPLYVNLHQSKSIRAREQVAKKKTAQDSKNLFVKNLKASVNENDFKNAFLEFGEITSVSVKDFTSKDSKVSARFGFVAFKNQDDAAKALNEGPNSAGVKALFLENATPYINIQQPKDQRTEFIKSQKRMKEQAKAFAAPPMARNFMNVPPQFAHMMPMGPQGFVRNFGKAPPKPFQGQWKGGNQRGGPAGHTGGHAGHNRPPRGPQDQGMRSANPMQQRPQQAAPQKTAPVQTKPAQSTQQATTTTPPSGNSVQRLRENLNEFLSYDSNTQRQILGELLFPLIRDIAGPKEAPKITGMLIDLSVLEITEILEFFENPDVLRERVFEALELIEQENNA
jgi:polyadenylate-binding protein